MMHEITKDGCLLVDRHQRLADVCRKLRSPSISTIAVCGKNGQIQGYIPLWHILQLLKENRAFIDQRIAACTVRQISEALQGTLCCVFHHEGNWKGLRVYGDDANEEMAHMLCVARGDRMLLTRAVRSAASCVIACGTSIISDSLIRETKTRHVSLICTEKGVHEACQTIILSLPLESLMIRKAH